MGGWCDPDTGRLAHWRMIFEAINEVRSSGHLAFTSGPKLSNSQAHCHISDTVGTHVEERHGLTLSTVPGQQFKQVEFRQILKSY